MRLDHSDTTSSPSTSLAQAVVSQSGLGSSPIGADSSVDRVDDIGTGTEATTPSAQCELSEHIERLDRDGYTILVDAFDLDVASRLRDDIARLERELRIGPGTNGFEGRCTTRVYNLLAHGPLYESIPVHPVVLALMHYLLGDGCLVSSLSSIAIGPGEIAQPIHADDQVMPLPKPHPATTANSMWALTDFTEANGATRIIPGTHAAGSPVYGQHYDSVPAEMPAGSILVWHGSLWHGGGANTTDGTRIGVAMNYCAGWVRQQENQQLGIPLDTVRGFSPELRELCGFGVYRGLIGHIDKQTPAQRLLDTDDRVEGHGHRMVWDRT
ncbi:MAG: phytanoyl-CoA dioxygenase family protein [Actinobacteria bacterium]|nr:phytanoyl-CoA dioxygenase family protein [Actinomycetota bacterium]